MASIVVIERREMETKIEAIENEIATLNQVEYLVATNSGTYGAEECGQKVGCGDPAFGDRNVYETVGGRVRATGPDHNDAPGRMRQVNAAALKTDRKRRDLLKRELDSLKHRLAAHVQKYHAMW